MSNYYGLGVLNLSVLLKEYWCFAGDLLRGELQISYASTQEKILDGLAIIKLI